MRQRDIIDGRHYMDRLGSVRLVVGPSEPGEGNNRGENQKNHDCIVYEVVVAMGRKRKAYPKGTRRVCTRAELGKWAKRCVERSGSGWAEAAKQT